MGVATMLFNQSRDIIRSNWSVINYKGMHSCLIKNLGLKFPHCFGIVIYDTPINIYIVYYCILTVVFLIRNRLYSAIKPFYHKDVNYTSSC